MTSSPPIRGFTKSEFENRTIKAQRLMTEKKIDAILLTTEPNVRYFSGFLRNFWTLVLRTGRCVFGYLTLVKFPASTWTWFNVNAEL